MASDRKVVGSGFESLGGHFDKFCKGLEDISIPGLFLSPGHAMPVFCHILPASRYLPRLYAVVRRAFPHDPYQVQKPWKIYKIQAGFSQLAVSSV